jgi:phosphatidylglycerol---prolipoprotein diacylglyceryl transferase
VRRDPLLLALVWKGISSFGGIIGGAAGFAIYVWRKQLEPRLMADVTLVGFLPAFSIGRIGCSIVSDHIGAAVDPARWYAALAMSYPRTAGYGPISKLIADHPDLVHHGYVRAWNLGLIELLYLIPVNAMILFLAFRSKKRLRTGLLAVIAAVLYAPVRFMLEFLRPEETDPRYGGLTFAQWGAIVAFGVAIAIGARILRSTRSATPPTRTRPSTPPATDL